MTAIDTQVNLNFARRVILDERKGGIGQLAD